MSGMMPPPANWARRLGRSAWSWRIHLAWKLRISVLVHLIRHLLNGRIQVLNPQTLLFRQGLPENAVYLLLSGIVETIRAQADKVDGAITVLSIEKQ